MVSNKGTNTSGIEKQKATKISESKSSLFEVNTAKISKQERVSTPSWSIGHRCRTTCFVARTRFGASVLNPSGHFWYKTIQGVNTIALRLTL